METILLQLNSSKALKLIEDLEALDVVTILKKNVTAKGKLSDRFAGALNLSEEEYKNFQDSVTQARGEWESDI